MKIKELYIAEFGCLRDRRITLADGLNLIEGVNGSGKSTVLLFIKFMLYGLPRRKAGDDGEHDRSVSWKGHVASGNMTVETSAGVFRLKRHYMETGGRRRAGVCQILNCADGSEVSFTGEPGEYFLGVPREVFESSAAIGQMRCAKIDGEKTASALGNLLTAADESVDVVKICDRLDKLRTEYLHKNRQGGRLIRQARELAELRSQLERESVRALRLAELTDQVSAEEEKIGAVRAELERARAIRDQRNDAFVLRRFEILHENEGAVAVKKNELAALVRETFGEGDCPAETHVGALRASADANSAAREAKERAIREEKVAGERTPDGEMVRTGEQMISIGGSKLYVSVLEARARQGKRQRKAGVGLLLAAALLAAGGIVCLLALPNVAPGVELSLLGAGLACFLGGIGFLAAGRKTARNVAENIAPYGKPLDELYGYLDACEQAAEDAARSKSEQETARARCQFAEDQAKRAEESLRRLLVRTLPDADLAAEELSRAAYREAERLESYFRAYGGLVRELHALERLVESEKAALHGYDEETLRGSVTVPLDSVTPEALEKANERCRFEAEKLRVLERAWNDHERERLTLQATGGDVMALRDRLAELTERQEADRAYYEALELAITSMRAAEESMRGNVTPELVARAGGWMKQASGGRYESVKATKELRLSLTEDGFPVAEELVSGGTRELAYLALRLSLVRQIYREERPPILLDEALCQLDNGRAERMLEILDACCAEGDQVILLTCHEREARLCEARGISVARQRMESV